MTPEERDWQSTLTNNGDRFLYLFENNLLTDVTFKVGTSEQIEIKSHALILSAASNIFYKIFNTSPNPIRTVEVGIVDVPIFMKFLKYIYTGQINLHDATRDELKDFRKLAKVFEMPRLERLCLERKFGNITIDNVLEILNVLDSNDTEIIERCLNLIGDNTMTILKHPLFMDISFTAIKRILEYQQLDCREIDLYETIAKWTERECCRKELEATPQNRRSVLGDSFYLIRFPTMNVDEVAKCANDGLLTGFEMRDLFLYIMENFDGDIKFVTRSRNPSIVKKDDEIYKICNIMKNPWQKGYDRLLSHELGFSVSRSITLSGIGILVSRADMIQTVGNRFKIKFYLSTKENWAFIREDNISPENCKQIQLNDDFNLIRLFFETDLLLFPVNKYGMTMNCSTALWDMIGSRKEKINVNDTIFDIGFFEGNVVELLVK